MLVPPSPMLLSTLLHGTNATTLRPGDVLRTFDLLSLICHILDFYLVSYPVAWSIYSLSHPLFLFGTIPLALSFI